MTARMSREHRRLIAAMDEYRVFEISVDQRPNPRLTYMVLGPPPFSCAIFGSLREAMDAAHMFAQPGLEFANQVRDAP